MGQAATSADEGAAGLFFAAVDKLQDADALLPDCSRCRLRGDSNTCTSAESCSVGDTGQGALADLLLRSCLLLLLVSGTSLTVG